MIGILTTTDIHAIAGMHGRRHRFRLVAVIFIVIRSARSHDAGIVEAGSDSGSAGFTNFLVKILK